MGQFLESITEALQLQARILADTHPPKKIDALFVYGQTQDNEPSILSTAAQEADKADWVVYSYGGKLTTGMDWNPDYDEKLIARGIPAKKILRTDLSEGLAHTHTEAIAFVHMAKKKGWETVRVISPAFHILRAFAETVTATVLLYPSLKVYSKVGTPLPWTETVLHSQFIEKGKRCDLVASEYQKCERYHGKNKEPSSELEKFHADIVELLSGRQILDYLNQRDQ